MAVAPAVIAVARKRAAIDIDDESPTLSASAAATSATDNGAVGLHRRPPKK